MISEKKREYHRKQYATCPEFRARTKKRRRLSRANEQKARTIHPKTEVCEICLKPPGDKPLCFDHDHTTDLHRGWLCHHCNIGLGHFGDSTELLERAKTYLEKRRYETES